MRTLENVIRSAQPLTLDRIRAVVPSAFAATPYHDRSDRYAFIPTSAVIESLAQVGMHVFEASQSRSRIEGKEEYTKHMLRFRALDNRFNHLGITPEVVLINSHDGTTRYKLFGGINVHVCSNGLITAETMLASISIMHSGRVIDEVATGTVQLVERMPETVDCIQRWKEIQLSQAEEHAYASAAHTLRFADAKGEVKTPIRPDQLLTVRRSEDRSNNLWTVFNRVQENVIQGGLRARGRDEFNRPTRRVTARVIGGIDQNVRLNRSLWTLTEEMAKIKTGVN